MGPLTRDPPLRKPASALFASSLSLPGSEKLFENELVAAPVAANATIAMTSHPTITLRRRPSTSTVRFLTVCSS